MNDLYLSLILLAGLLLLNSSFLSRKPKEQGSLFSSSPMKGSGTTEAVANDKRA